MNPLKGERYSGTAVWVWAGPMAESASFQPAQSLGSSFPARHNPPPQLPLLGILIVKLPRVESRSFFETQMTRTESSVFESLGNERSSLTAIVLFHCPSTLLDDTYGCCLIIQEIIYKHLQCGLFAPQITNRSSWTTSNAPSIASRAELWPKIGFGPRVQTHMGRVGMSVWYHRFDGCLERSTVHIAWSVMQVFNGLISSGQHFRHSSGLLAAARALQ